MLSFAIELFIWMAIATFLGMLIGWLTWGKKLNLILYKYSNLYSQAQLEKNQNSKKIAKLFKELETSQQKLLVASEQKYTDLENLYINQLEKELEDEKLRSSEFENQVEQLKSQLDPQ